MARETKVGLIVGLGVILFVGIFVSDYLSAPSQTEGASPEVFANFHDRTTNQPRIVITREQQETAPAGPSDFAAVALDNIEERFGPPTQRAGNAYTPDQPPFRPGGQGPTATQLAAQSDTETPVAMSDPRMPINEVTIDTPDLAGAHQIQLERLGPGATNTHDVAVVESPEPETLGNRAPAQVQHTVGNGETLTAIARRYYDGDGNLWYSIRDANPGKVGANGEVREGTVLVIPRRSVEAEPTEITPRAGGTADGRPRPRARLIEVQEGQTLSEIALKHLGSANKWQVLLDANTDVLEKPEHLRAGMRLRIPPQKEIIIATEANTALSQDTHSTPARTEQPADTGNTYTVQSGDSLYRIAASELGNGERYNEIFEANRDKLRSADDIRVGMTLSLPAR